MTTTLTPPPVPPVPPASTPPTVPGRPPREPSAAGRVIAILAIVLGGLIIVGTVFGAVTSTVASALVHTETRSIPVAGATALDVDLSAGQMSVVFVAGQTEAELEVTGSMGAGAWTLAMEGDTLTVATPSRFFFGPSWWFGGSGSAVLRLPAELQSIGLDASFELAAGELTVTGEFADLGLELGAGRATVSGSADHLVARVNAGAADLSLADVGTAEFVVNAGAVTSEMTGTPPQSITVDLSAGSATLRVPEGEYHVRTDVSAGDIDNRIASTPGARNTIDVQVSAGQVTLR